MAAWAEGSERKLATVLFADLVGSTELGEQDPERTRVLLERFYDAMAAEVEAAGGTLEKFVGDAVMAAFGVPAAQEDHAERALHAALSMQRTLGELFGERLSLRIGVNTGEVVAGRARAGGSFVTGDAVNVAKRLEEAAAPGEILAGERTAAAVRGAFELGDARTVEAKGKSVGVPARPVVRALSLMRPRGVRGSSAAFVGREPELELLRATYRRTVELAEPHLVTLMGDAGIGKTRLLRELWRWLAGQEPQPLQRTGRSLPYGRVTYWALGEVVREHFGLLGSDPPDRVRERIGGREGLGLALGLPAERDLHPLAAHELLHDAWVAFLSELAAERPAVVLVEDLHWAEEPLLDLLERVLRDVRGPLLLLATSRPELLERRPAWGGGRRNASLVWLEPLAAADTERLVGELLSSDVPEEVRSAVVARAEGNPFVVEEVLGALIDRGTLRRTGDAWESSLEGDGLIVPDSVHSLLAARIDLLPPREKAALQAASVIGRVFWEGPVVELLGGERPDWTLLEDRDFVRRQAGSSVAGEVERAVKHAYTREVAYATLPKARRARLHAAFADWVERLGSARDEYAALLAHHYVEAVRPEDADLAWAGDEDTLGPLRAKALSWSIAAAAGAVARYELADARALLEPAIALAATGNERARVLRALARTYALEFAGEEFWTAMQAAIAEVETAELEADLYADLAYETAVRSGIWRRMPERELVDGWVDRALAHSGPDGVSRAKALIARARWRPADADAAAVEATELAERLGDPELRSAAWDARGITDFVAGRFDDGRFWAERRFELLDQISDPDIRADIHAAPITACIWNARFDEARRLAHVHDEIASRLSRHHRVHAVAIDVEVEELIGDWQAVLGLQERTETLVADNAATPCVRNPRTLLVCALANELTGDATTARVLEERALEQWMEGYGFTLDTPRLRLALARHDLEAVERLLDLPETAHGWHRGWFVFANVSAWLDALAALGRRERVEELAQRYVSTESYLQPFALRALGRVREDETLVVRALERFEALGLGWHAAETRLVLEV
jgi:class 3 adenylate cyclase